MITYMVEDYSSEIKFAEKSNIIALSPRACYDLDKAGIEYSIIEDYYSHKKLGMSEKEYFLDAWDNVRKLDGYLKKHVAKLKDLDLNIASLYIKSIKLTLDPVYVRCYTLKKLFEKKKIKKIIYVMRKKPELPINDNLTFESGNLYSKIVPLFCDANEIELDFVFVDEKVKSDSETSLNIIKRNAIKKITGNLGFSFEFFKHSLSKTSDNKKKVRKMKILALTQSHLGQNFIMDTVKRGHNLYLVNDKSIHKYTPFGLKKHVDIPSYSKELSEKESYYEEFRAIIKDFKKSGFIKWFNSKCGVDVLEIILPRLEFFISRICPEILNHYIFFFDFLKNETIDFVITPYAISIMDFGLLRAAVDSEHTKAVGIQHGNEISFHRETYIRELNQYNIYLCTDDEIHHHLKKISSEMNIPTKIYTTPHRLLPILELRNELDKKNSHQKVSVEQSDTIDKKKKCIYAPIGFHWDQMLMNGWFYPDTWYYKFQISIINHLSNIDDYIFIWKTFRGNDFTYNPIIDFINDKQFENIEVATDPLPKFLTLGYPVILDFPSTGFYESIVAGNPTLGLYHDSFVVRQSAVKYFGKIVRKYSNAEEAVKYIDEFLKNDQKDFRSNIETSGRTILDILEENI